MRLKRKVALVTGGGSGIGRGIALMFAKEGATVTICGRREDPLKETVSLIDREGGKAGYIVADISLENEREQFVEETLKRYKQIDILVNNAGIFKGGDVIQTSEDDWDKVIDIDLKGVFLLSKEVLPHMLDRKSGKIIHIASIAGLCGFAKCAAYAAAKGAVINLTRQMGLDYASKGICVNAIAPGVIESEMTRDFLEDEVARENFLTKTPVGRIGKPEDIAYAAVYLASKESDFVVGQTIIVDGGWTIY